MITYAFSLMIIKRLRHPSQPIDIHSLASTQTGCIQKARATWLRMFKGHLSSWHLEFEKEFRKWLKDYRVMKIRLTFAGQAQPPRVRCMFCKKLVARKDAHRYQQTWIGECCWDERLRGTE